MFHFLPLLGAQAESPASQSLLELDGGVKILIDVGWDETFDADKLLALEKHVSTLSIILLTHPTLDHLGAYAHCCKHVPLFAKVPIYATTPVINLGRALLTDVYTSAPAAASLIPLSVISASPVATGPDASPKLLLQAPTPDEIASYFALINPLKYSQPHQPIPSPFSPPLGGLTITAYGAGHTLGGTIWHIQHGLESIVYGADWNQGRENLISGASWLSSVAGGAEIIEPLRRPTALICSSKGVESTNPLPRKKRDDVLVGLIRETIAQGGKVLIPTDSSARVLELAFMLNQKWRENVDGPHVDTYRNVRIYMAGKSSSSSVRYLQSMLEWVDDAVRVDAEAANPAAKKNRGEEKVVNPLDWSFVKQLERQSQVERVLARGKPCVILASDASLEWGFSQQALRSLADDPTNLVLLTGRIARLSETDHGIGRQLWELWRSRQGQGSTQSGAQIINSDGIAIKYFENRTVGLSSEEDTLYQTYRVRQRQLHNTMQGDSVADDPTTAGIADDQASESSDSEDEDEGAEHQGRALNLSAQLTQSTKRKVGLTDAELGVNVLLRSKTIHDYDVRNKRGREKIFPFVAHKARNDDFGDLIKPEDYLRAEERDEIDGVDMRDGTKAETSVGQKRKWDETASSQKGRKTTKAQTKRAKVETRSSEPDDIDAAIARATGQTSTGSGPNGVDADEDDDSEESDYEPEDSTPEGPRKLITTEHSIMLNLRISYVDFAGLHEKRDMQMLIPLIRPRKLILIAGEAAETQTLAEECRTLLNSDSNTSSTDVFAPVTGELVDASVDTNAWTLKLSRQLVKNLVWQNVKGLGIVALTGRLDVTPTSDNTLPDLKTEDDDGSAKKKLKLLSATSTASAPTKLPPSIPTLDLLPTTPTHHAPAPTSQPIHVGDLRLASLRALILANGHTAEFRGEGTLLVDNSVVVRKSSSGAGGGGGGGNRIEILAAGDGWRQPGWRTRENEGSFFAVRRVIYEGLGVVGAG